MMQSYHHALHPVRFAAMTPKLTQAKRQPSQWISSGCGDVENANPPKYVSVIQVCDSVISWAATCLGI